MQRFKAAFREDSPFRAFLLSILFVSLAYGLYQGIFNNYLAEIVGATEMDKGVSEFFRELPGALMVLILAVLYSFSAEKLFKLGMGVMVAGFALHGLLPPDKVLIILAVLFFSFGDHLQMGMRNTLALNYSAPQKGGEALGTLNSVHQIGMLAGYLAVAGVLLLLPSLTGYTGFFYAAAALTLVALVFALMLKSSSETDANKRRFYFRKKFTKYYMLEVFYGARKQVFFTFGPFVLILFYGASAATISLLFAVSSVACFLLAPAVGRLIDRVGYKAVMIGDTLVLVIVCFFYGFAHHFFTKDVAFIVCCVNYVLDSVISLASMASNVYVQDLSDSPAEMKATISTGVSVNHLITIFIALFGGWIWKTLGIETLFILSAVLGLCNSAYAATIKKPAKRA